MNANRIFTIILDGNGNRNRNGNNGDISGFELMEELKGSPTSPPATLSAPLLIYFSAHQGLIHVYRSYLTALLTTL